MFRNRDSLSGTSHVFEDLDFESARVLGGIRVSSVPADRLQSLTKTSADIVELATSQMPKDGRTSWRPGSQGVFRRLRPTAPLNRVEILPNGVDVIDTNNHQTRVTIDAGSTTIQIHQLRPQPWSVVLRHLGVNLTPESSVLVAAEQYVSEGMNADPGQIGAWDDFRYGPLRHVDAAYISIGLKATKVALTLSSQIRSS